MERKWFNEQIDRLRSQWPHGYGPERLARIWQLYEKVDNALFSEIVDAALDTMRSAPLAKDFKKLEGEITERRCQQRAYEGLSVVSVDGVLGRAERVNQTADKDFVRACSKHRTDFLTGKISRAAFDEGCKVLDELANQLNPSGKVIPFNERHRPRRDD
jgi:hypothetical protein